MKPIVFEIQKASKKQKYKNLQFHEHPGSPLSLYLIKSVTLTPSEQYVQKETLALLEGGDENDVMQIEALHEYPYIVCHDDVVEYGKHQFTGPVLKDYILLS